MRTKCKCCGSITNEKDAMCKECKTLLQYQNTYFEANLKEPIVYCLVPDCSNLAMHKGICKQHSKQFTHNMPKSTTIKTINNLSNGRLDSLLTRRIEENQEINIHTEDLNIKEPREMVKEVMKETPTLPDFLINNPVFKSPEKGYCESEYRCCNEIYKDGLCKTHYDMKHGLKFTEPEISTLRQGLASLPTQLKYEKKAMRYCASEGCNRPTTHTKYCISCSQKRAKTYLYRKPTRTVK